MGSIRQVVGAAIAGLCVSLSGLTAQSAENWPDAVNEYVVGPRKGIDTINSDGYQQVIKNPNGALTVDVRDEDELKAGTVPGAINISRGRLEFRIWRVLGYPGKIDTTRKIYLQCNTGGRATVAAKQLKDIVSRT